MSYSQGMVCQTKFVSQFNIGEVRRFFEAFAIKHITTPAYHPRSNGQVERFIDTFKSAPKKPGNEEEKYSNSCLYIG